MNHTYSSKTFLCTLTFITKRVETFYVKQLYYFSQNFPCDMTLIRYLYGNRRETELYPIQKIGVRPTTNI